MGDFRTQLGITDWLLAIEVGCIVGIGLIKGTTKTSSIFTKRKISTLEVIDTNP